MPINSVTIKKPDPGTTIPTAAPASPDGHMKGEYTLDNAPLDYIKCRIVYPATTGLLLPQLIIERNADILAGGKWRVDFGALSQGLDTCMQAELYVQGAAERKDFGMVEDIDVLNDPVGTLNPPQEIPLPTPTIP